MKNRAQLCGNSSTAMWSTVYIVKVHTQFTVHMYVLLLLQKY